MSLRTWLLTPDASIGQSPNGPGMEGSLNKKMAAPSTLLLTGGNTDALPIAMNPAPDNRADPILPVFQTLGFVPPELSNDTQTLSHEGQFVNGAQAIGNFPGTTVGNYLFTHPLYGFLFHFLTPPYYTVDAASLRSRGHANLPFEWVTKNTRMAVVDTVPDPATGGFVFETSLGDQFVGYQDLTDGGIWWSEPGEFYMTLWVYFQDLGTNYPYGGNGGFFQMGNLPSENGCQMYFYLKNSVPMVDIFFGINNNPSGSGQSANQVPMVTYSFVTNLGFTGAGLYQLGLYYKNDGRNITIGGSVGSMDPVVNFSLDPSGNNGLSNLHFVQPVTMPAPFGLNSLVTSQAAQATTRAKVGFSSSDINYGSSLAFIAYRAVIENTAATGRDPIAQIVADFNHFAGMVYTPVDPSGNPLPPVVGLKPTLDASSVPTTVFVPRAPVPV